MAGMQERREPLIGALERSDAEDRIPVLSNRAEQPPASLTDTTDTAADIADRVLELVAPALRAAIAEALAEHAATGERRGS